MYEVVHFSHRGENIVSGNIGHVVGALCDKVTARNKLWYKTDDADVSNLILLFE